MRCPNCGAENQADLRFCEHCGTLLKLAAPPQVEATRAEAPPQRACPECGAQNAAALRFCEQCGAALETAALSQIEAPGGEASLQQACPECGAQNAAALRFCEQCGAALEIAIPSPIEPSPVPLPTRPRRRWIRWAAAGAGLMLVAIVGLFLLPDLKPTPSDEQAAIDVATLIVEEAFPEYVGAQRTVTEWEAGDGKDIYVISYSFEADPANGEPYPRGLNIYFDPETRQVSIEEKN